MTDQFRRLWEVMEESTGTVAEWGGVIRAVRDWLVPEEETTPMLPAGYNETYTRWHERQRLRDLLTTEADRARALPLPLPTPEPQP